MNVGIGTEAAHAIPFRAFINWVFGKVQAESTRCLKKKREKCKGVKSAISVQKWAGIPSTYTPDQFCVFKYVRNISPTFHNKAEPWGDKEMSSIFAGQ